MCIRTKTFERFQRDLAARGMSASTIATYQRCVQRFLKQLHRPPSRARESDIRDYVVSLRQQYCARSVNVHIAALRCFDCETLRRSELFSRVRRLRVQPSPVTILGGSEVLRLLEATRSPKYRALILLMYAAGLRISEALRLCVEDIDSHRMLLRIRRSKTKPRYVPMSPQVLSALREHWRAARLKGPELFPGRAQGTVATRNGVKRALDKIQRSAELSKHVTPHTFRQLGFTGWHPLGVEAEAKQPDQHEDEAHNAEQDLDSALELQHPHAERPFVLAEELRCDDGSGTAPNPTCRRGARDPQLSEESRVTLLANEVTQSMVVGSAAGAVHWPGMVRPGH